MIQTQDFSPSGGGRQVPREKGAAKRGENLVIAGAKRSGKASWRMDCTMRNLSRNPMERGRSARFAEFVAGGTPALQFSGGFRVRRRFTA
jgi:hypothetical protein